jgi:AmiR/NasT family two-component response regulator
MRRQLRVLLADGQQEYLDFVASIVLRLGHLVVAKATDLEMVATLSEHDPPDVALVVVGESSERALGLIRRIVREATCPVIVLLSVEDAAFIEEAARCGVFAYVANGEMTDDRLGSAISVVLHRFAEYHDLQGAFGRRAVTERAKGILMERHSIDEEAAFRMLRDRSRRGGRKLIDIAQSVIEARSLLPKRTTDAGQGQVEAPDDADVSQARRGRGGSYASGPSAAFVSTSTWRRSSKTSRRIADSSVSTASAVVMNRCAAAALPASPCAIG